jgi:hypothetical protein
MSRILPPFINVNQSGIPAIKSNTITVGTADVRFDFNNHRNVGRPFRGLLVVYLAQVIPAGTTATLPIVFTSDSGNPKEVTTFNGDAITVADIPGMGVYLFWYESQSDTLQLLTGTIA